MSVTVLYPEERQIPDDGLEAEIFGAEVRIMRRTVKVLAELDPADCAEVDGLMIMRYPVTPEDIARFPRLRAIVRMGVGYDRIARPAAAARNILVCNVPDYGTTEVADHAMALALSLRRGVILYHERQRQNPPAPWGPVKCELIRRLGVQTFGIIGLGRIGTAVALRARAFGFRVMFYDPHLPNGAELALGIGRAATLEDLLRQTDTLSVHTPLTPETRGMLGATELALLRKGAVVVNTRAGRSSISMRCWRYCATAISPPRGWTCCRSNPRSSRSPNCCAPTAPANQGSKADSSSPRMPPGLPPNRSTTHGSNRPRRCARPC
jgi:phosphoglycerate dehydrogenase-like enzyme